MDRSAEVQTIMQIMSNQDIQIKYAKEKADKWIDIHNTLVNSRKATQALLNKIYCKQLHDLTEQPQENAVEEQFEESAEVSVEEEVVVACAESEEVIDNSGVTTQENAIFGKKESNKA